MGAGAKSAGTTKPRRFVGCGLVAGVVATFDQWQYVIEASDVDARGNVTNTATATATPPAGGTATPSR